MEIIGQVGYGGNLGSGLYNISISPLITAQASAAAANVVESYPNDTATGTLPNELAKGIDNYSVRHVIVTSAGDAAGALGVVTANAGVTGNATVTRAGYVNVWTDTSTVPGDLAVQSSTNPGMVSDIGTSCPVNGHQVVGIFTSQATIASPQQLPMSLSNPCVNIGANLIISGSITNTWIPTIEPAVPTTFSRATRTRNTSFSRILVQFT